MSGKLRLNSHICNVRQANEVHIGPGAHKMGYGRVIEWSCNYFLIVGTCWNKGHNVIKTSGKYLERSNETV